MEKKVMKLASRGKRLGAYLIDRVVPVILSMITLGSIVALCYTPRILMPYTYGFGNGYGGLDGGYSDVGSVLALLVCMLIYIAYLVVQLIFYSKSKTIGKAILGMQVISSKNGEPVDFWVMLLREWFAKKASKVVFCLGFIWILIDDRNRAWHDKIMDTYVIDLKETENLRKSSKSAAAKTVPVTVTEEPQSVADTAAEEPQSVADTVVEEPQIMDDAAVEQPQNIEVETVVAEKAENEDFTGE